MTPPPPNTYSHPSSLHPQQHPQQKHGQRSTRPKSTIQTNRTVRTICGWPTDIVSIDHTNNNDNDENNNNHHRAEAAEEECLPILPHTIIVFVPGNPGTIGFYISMLETILQRLGTGYAVRAASHAGHGIGRNIVGTARTVTGSDGRTMIVPPSSHDDNGNDNGKKPPTIRNSNTDVRNTDIAWTIEGQVEHKIAYVDWILDEMSSLLHLHQRKQTQTHTPPPPTTNNNNNNNNNTPQKLPKLIFLTHSIGAHLVQNILLLRPDLLHRSTRLILHLMPFIRFDPPSIPKFVLSTVARYPHLSIPLFRTLTGVVGRCVPGTVVDCFLERIVGIDGVEGRDLARGLYGGDGEGGRSVFGRNFLELGLREIRELPRKVHDYATLRTIAKHCPTTILFCTTPVDQWAPPFHASDLLSAMKEESSDVVGGGSSDSGNRGRGRLLPSSGIDIRYARDGTSHDFIVHAEMVPPVVDFVVDVIERRMRMGGVEERVGGGGVGLVSRL